MDDVLKNATQSEKKVIEFYEKYHKLGEFNPKIFVQKIISPASWINPFTGAQEEMKPNDPQLSWMTNATKAVNVWSAGNSTGKSFGAALKIIWFMTYKKRLNHNGWGSYGEYEQAPYKILITGPESKQAMGLFQQVEFLIRNSPFLSRRLVGVTMGTKRDPHAALEMSNGASCHAVSTKNRGKSIEGGDYDWTFFDEPADEIHLEFVVERVLLPRMFRRGGGLDMISTPKGNMNKYFIDEYIKGAGMGDDYYDPDVYSPTTHYAQNNSSTENPFADQNTIRAYKNSKDDKIVQERIHGKFVSFDDAAFPENVIRMCHNDELPEEIGPSSKRQYVTGVDFGRKNDYTVSMTVDVTEKPWTVVHFGRWGGGNVSWEFIFSQLLDIFKIYQSDFFIDATGAGGDMQGEWLDELGVYNQKFIYTPTKKVVLINNLQDIMARGWVQFPTIKKLIDELRFYPRSLDDKKLETDCVMALALACLSAKDFVDLGEPYEY